jgi:hypothetical protein
MYASYAYVTISDLEVLANGNTFDLGDHNDVDDVKHQRRNLKGRRSYSEDSNSEDEDSVDHNQNMLIAIKAP